jgi:DNA polymerase III delta prime subunit
MTSFLIVSKDKNLRRDYILNFCKEKVIAAIDITTIEKDETKQSLGIDDVKRMQKKLFLRPIQSETKAVILEDAQFLTTEAQNAMLKILEEPPEHTIILLAADSEDSLLPTIQSRCQIIKVGTYHGMSLPEGKDAEEIKQFLTQYSYMSIPQALKFAETLAKDKQKAIEWVEKVVIMSREQLLVLVSDEKSASRIDSGHTLTGTGARNIIRVFQTLHTQLKTTNVNPRFAIENALLHLIQ